MARDNKEHVQEFAGMPVRRYTPRRGIVRPESSCQRIGREFRYGDPQGELGFDELLDGFLAKPASARVAGLVIGPWWDEAYDEQPSSAGVVAMLVAARDRLPNLRAIFLGDITYEENEITWIKQCDVTPLLQAFPRLEHLKIRGAGQVEGGRRSRGKAEANNRLRLQPVRHAHLKSLVIEAGCLPADVSRAVAASRLPALEHLELWLGASWSSDCGDSGNTTVEDLEPILKGKAFAALKSLGLRNSQITPRPRSSSGSTPSTCRSARWATRARWLCSSAGRFRGSSGWTSTIITSPRRSSTA
jgi:hypothetical protein